MILGRLTTYGMIKVPPEWKKGRTRSRLREIFWQSREAFLTWMGEMWRCYCLLKPWASYLRLDKEIKTVKQLSHASCGEMANCWRMLTSFRSFEQDIWSLCLDRFGKKRHDGDIWTHSWDPKTSVKIIYWKYSGWWPIWKFLGAKTEQELQYFWVIFDMFGPILATFEGREPLGDLKTPY